MTVSKKHLRVRDSRDRLIELLRIGETSPIRDLPVLVDHLVIPMNVSAKIPIEETQLDSVYKLWHPTDDVAIERDAGVLAEEPGNDATIQLESPVIAEDQTFRIRAVKDQTGRWAYLHHPAEIKTGLDPSLSTWIRSGALFDPSVESLQKTDPRIVDHGTEVEVVVENSQEGVDYRLVVLAGEQQTVISQAEVRGTLANIVLRTHAVTGDINIRVAGTRTFDPTEGLPPQEVLLDAVLPLVVRASAALAVTVTPGTNIDYQGMASVAIENSEPGVTYQLYGRLIPDRDFVYAPGEGITSIATSAETDSGRVVHVVASVASVTGLAPAGFTAIGSPAVGDGGTLNMSLGSLAEDNMVLIEARKLHLDKAGDPRESAVLLDVRPAILVRPDPAPGLGIDVIMSGAATAGAAGLSGGQAGVYYQLRQEPDGPDIGRPGYFHKRDHDDPTDNKGIGQLAIGIDAAVTRATWASLERPDIAGLGVAAVGQLVVGEVRGPPVIAGARSRTAAPAPIVMTPALAVDTVVGAHAVKAMTGLSAAVTGTVTITALPSITVKKTIVDDELIVKLRVSPTDPEELYKVFQGSIQYDNTKRGNDAARNFVVATSIEDMTYQVVMMRAQESGPTLVRIALVTVPGDPLADPGAGT